jgi:error-prone DNA polymerase
MAFAHLNVHSAYSLLSGTLKPEAIPVLARRRGADALALTDTDGLYAAVPFQQACEREGLRSILGAEVTRPRQRRPVGSQQTELLTEPTHDDESVRNPGGFARERPAGPGDPRHRATLLARNDAGYRILGELITARHRDPAFDLERELATALDSGELYLLCAGEGLLHGLAPVELAARARGRESRLFVELRPGGGLIGGLRRQARLHLAEKLGLPAVVTTGAFFADPEEHALHRLLCAMRMNCAEEKLSPDAEAGPDAWLMDEAALRRALGLSYALKDPRLEEAIAASTRIAADCHARIPLGRPRPPRFKLPAGADGRPQHPDAFLYRLAHAGLRERLGLAPGDVDRRARRTLSALRRELHVIRRREVSAYFLIAWDLVRHGRGRNLASLGRGSAAGSLVSFALGVTHVNPLEHSLYFERFLNLERAGLPDFDIDFGSEARHEILDYAFRRYGRDRTAMIATYQSFRPRGAFRHLVAALGLDESVWDPLIKLLPRWGSCVDIAERLREDPRSRHLDLSHGDWPRLLELAARLDGLPRHLGTHPCGIVIAPGPIAHYVPLQPGAQGLAITQWDMHAVEAAGLVKMDILGQRGLAVIDATAARVRENFGRAPRLAGDPPPRIGARSHSEADDAVNPFTDRETRALLSRGGSKGCFYIESPIMMLILRQARCDDFETLTALSSIIRPGVSNHGGKRAYLKRHRGEEPVSLLHPLLEPLLRDTYGCLIYQEQVMRVLQVVGGMSLGEADRFRKIMSGKGGGRSSAKEFTERFLAAALARLEAEGETPEEAERIAVELGRQVASFAGYAFCKAHSASFARESFESAYWKAHYPAEFMAAVIEERGGYYGSGEYVEEARRLGVEILPPHVNAGTLRCLGYSTGARASDPAGEAGRLPGANRRSRGRLRVGLSFVGGLRRAALAWLARDSGRRAFTSLAELVERARWGGPEAPRRYELARLIRVGALDGLPPESGPGTTDRPQLLTALAEYWRGHSDAKADAEAFAPLNWPDLDDTDAHRRTRGRLELAGLGFTASLHPLQLSTSWAAARRNTLTARQLMARAEAAERNAGGEAVNLGQVELLGMKVAGKRTRTEKDGRLMAFFTLSDETDTFELVLYPDDYVRLARGLRGPGPFRVRGRAVAELGELLVEAKGVAALGGADS